MELLDKPTVIRIIAIIEEYKNMAIKKYTQKGMSLDMAKEFPVPETLTDIQEFLAWYTELQIEAGQ